MGTFLGHLVPGLALALLGLWHTINTIGAYHTKGPTKFILRFWYPLKTPLCKLEHIELILVLSFSVFAILMQIIDFPYMQFSFKLDNFEHATMFLHLAIFAGYTLFLEYKNSSDTPVGVSGVLAASVFGQELFLLHFHSTDHVGLEGHYHWLLQLIVCISLVAAIFANCFPTSFPASLVLTVSVVFQGCWLINMGFVLWIHKFVPLGCTAESYNGANGTMLGAVLCETQEADLRARALANLQFSWILAAILMVTASISLVLDRQRTPPRLSPEYEQLDSNRSHDVGFKQIQL
ncbi:transmembrane 45B-like [Olea europaea subsp. europaea]|uniref:Transmembrane 45B-like n=1 Tax=Olea europaea subsp. europaea TaxID=158383 RepID=A0A8S0PCW7_OLEEU|nr:transmembrane 45B-like [Olea europaea subsp. europaea]